MRPSSPFPLFRNVMQFLYFTNEEIEVYRGQVAGDRDIDTYIERYIYIILTKLGFGPTALEGNQR